MACCGTSCDSGCGGYGNGGVLVDSGGASEVNVHPGPTRIIVGGSRLRENGGVRVSCRCVCGPECCIPCGSGCGAGGNAPGVRVDIIPSYSVARVGGACLLASNNGSVTTSCSDPCCGPC